VDPHLVPKTSRRGDGALALGQDQDCLGGCFSPSNSFDGEMAVVSGGGGCVFLGGWGWGWEGWKEGGRGMDDEGPSSLVVPRPTQT